jgi:predicted Rossmann-fold nucleotide-binding protein
MFSFDAKKLTQLLQGIHFKTELVLNFRGQKQQLEAYLEFHYMEQLVISVHVLDIIGCFSGLGQISSLVTLVAAYDQRCY